MSAAATASNAVQHLPVFLTHAFLDAAFAQQRGCSGGSVLLSQLSSLHSSLPLPLTLFSYLYSVLQHLTLHTATAACLSPSADAAAIAAFSPSLCRGLLQHHRRRLPLSSLLPPLTEAVSHHLLAFPQRGTGDELIEQLIVSYVAAAVSQSLLLQCRDPQAEQARCGLSAAVSSVPSSSSSSSQPTSRAVWLELVQSVSDPSTVSISSLSSLSVSPLPLTSRLLLAPLSAVAAAAREQPDKGQAAVLCMAAELAVSFSSSIVTSAPSCLTAYAHCLQTVMTAWIVHLCTPPHLLPSLSPFPALSPPSAPLTTLATALPSHCVLRLVLDLIRLLHSATSRFPAAYLPVAAAELPERPSSPVAAVSSSASVCHCLHTLLTSSSVPLSAVLDALLQEEAGEGKEKETEDLFPVAVSFLSCLLSSGLPASYASAFHAYLLHQLTSSSRIAVPLLSALSSSLYSARLPLFEPTVSACRRWKEAHDREAAHAAPSQPESQSQPHQQQQQQQQRILELILCMARSHRTISAMFGIAPSNSVICSPPSPSPAAQLLSSTGYDSWCALLRLYASCPASCLHAVRLYASRSAAQERDWLTFLSSSLNTQLFQRILQFSSSAPAADSQPTAPVQEAGSSSSSQQPCGPSLFHSFSSLLSELLQRRCLGSDCISACLEQPPAALSSLLTISSSVASCRPLSPVHLRSLLSPFLHFSPSSSSRFPLQSFAPPHLPALFSLVLTYLSSLSSASASCLCLITVIASYSPAYSRRVLAFSLSAHLRRHLPLLSSRDPVISRTAAKAASLALVLCEEAGLEVDAVWDEQMSQLCLQEVTQWAIRHIRTAVLEQDGGADIEVSLPPLLSLLERAVVAESEGGHWLPQLSRRVSASSASSPRIGSLQRSRKLLQLLSTLLLSPPSSPPSLLHLAHRHLPAAVQDRLQLLAAHVQRMHSVQSEAADCLCEERELRFAHRERRAASREKVMQAEAFEPQPAEGREVEAAVSKWRHGGELASRRRAQARQAASNQQPAFQQPRWKEADSSDLGHAHEPGHSRKRRRQMDETDAGFATDAHCDERVEAEKAEDDEKEAEAVGQQSDAQRQLRLFLQSSPSDLLNPRCAVRHSAVASCCSSLSLPPFRRWLRWLVLVSFLTPMPVEKCYAHVLAHYVPLQPLDQLLSDAFTVAAASARDRRRRGLCPVLSVDLPPLMEAMLSAAQMPSPSPSARPHWLLHCLLSLLSPADSASASSSPLLVLSVADVLRTLPSSSAVLLPPSSPPPASPALLRLLSSVQTDAFMVAWLLRAAASYCQQGASSHHRSLLVAFLRRHFRLLRVEQHEAAIRCVLDEEQLLFLHELQRPQQQQHQQHQAAAGTVDGVEDRDESAARAVCLPSADEEELQDGGAAALAEAEVDWSTACDDDANAALLSRTERERKASRRGQQPLQPSEARVQPFSDQDDAQDEQPNRRSVQTASATCDAQTQTAPSPAPSLSPALTAGEPQPDLLALLLPSYDPRLSVSPSPRPLLSAAAGLPPTSPRASSSGDPFELPEAVQELTGFVSTDDAAATPAATPQSMDSSASATASSTAAASLRPPSARPPAPRHAVASFTSPARPSTSVPKPLSAHSARATFTPTPRSHLHLSSLTALSTPPPAAASPAQLSPPSSSGSPATAFSASSIPSSPFPHLRSDSIVLKRAARPPPITDNSSSGLAVTCDSPLRQSVRPQSPWVKRLDEETQAEQPQSLKRRRVLLLP